MRTHFCGLVSEALIGQSVTLCGWADVARNLGGLCFIAGWASIIVAAIKQT